MLFICSIGFDVGVMINKSVEILDFHLVLFGVIIDFAVLGILIK